MVAHVILVILSAFIFVLIDAIHDASKIRKGISINHATDLLMFTFAATFGSVIFETIWFFVLCFSARATFFDYLLNRMRRKKWSYVPTPTKNTSDWDRMLYRHDPYRVLIAKISQFLIVLFFYICLQILS